MCMPQAVQRAWSKFWWVLCRSLTWPRIRRFSKGAVSPPHQLRRYLHGAPQAPLEDNPWPASEGDGWSKSNCTCSESDSWVECHVNDGSSTFLTDDTIGVVKCTAVCFISSPHLVYDTCLDLDVVVGRAEWPPRSAGKARLSSFCIPAGDVEFESEEFLPLCDTVSLAATFFFTFRRWRAPLIWRTS